MHKMEEEKREEQPLKQEVSISDVKPKLLAPKTECSEPHSVNGGMLNLQVQPFSPVHSTSTVHSTLISIIVNGGVLKLPPKLRKLVRYSFFCFLFFLI